MRHLDDVNAWQSFVNQYGPLIYRFCRNRGLQDADAADVTQEVFRQLGKSFPSFKLDSERGRFRSWLGTITRNEISRFLKKIRRPGFGTGGANSDGLLKSLASDGEAIWLEEFNAHVYHSLLAQLRLEFDDATWRAFEMLWIDDVPAATVARLMDREIGWVYRAKFNVLSRLRAEVLALAEDLPGFANL